MSWGTYKEKDFTDSHATGQVNSVLKAKFTTQKEKEIRVVVIISNLYNLG